MTALMTVKRGVVLCFIGVASATFAQSSGNEPLPATVDVNDAGSALVLPTELPVGVGSPMDGFDAGVVAIEAPPAPTPAPRPARDENVDAVVTGSRIRRKDLSANAPLAVFTREQIAATGRSNVGEFLQTLPESSNQINRATNNGGDGSIRVNLRGISPASTLILLNGRRLTAGGTGANASVDMSAIPTNVIERIEVLKDGSSAVYGSDAVAGVINIITRKKMNGAEAVVYGSTTTFGDGQQLDINGIVGTSGDKGSAFLSTNFYAGAPIYAGNREYSQYQYSLFRDETGMDIINRSGSGTIPAGRVVIPRSQLGVANGNQVWNDLVGANRETGSFIRRANGSWEPYRTVAGQPALPEDGGDAWNFQPYNYLVTPQNRFNIFSSGEYRLGDYARIFYDAFYSKRTSQQLLAPEPLLTDSEGVTVSADNLYNPFGRDFAAVRRRLLEFGGRRTTQEINNFHITLGIDGDLPASAGFFGNWHWDAAFIFSRNDSSNLREGNLRNTLLQNAVGPSYIDGAGVPRCGTPTNPVPPSGAQECVPLNLFGGPGSITREMVNYLTFTGVNRGNNQLMGGQVNITGELFRIAAERKVAIAFGYDGRVLSGEDIPDPITVAGETTGNKGLITRGSFNVHEGYGELTIPIVDKLPGLDLLEVSAAVRGSAYSNFGTVANWKVGGRYRPIRDLTFRGTVSTAFRAPTVPELFGGQSDNFASVTDPCANVRPGTALARNCGDAANNGDDQTQLRSRVGGNPALQPEKALTYTLGGVFEPRFLKGFALTVDYWNLNLTQTVSTFGENVILQGCYPTGDDQQPNQEYCRLVTRDPASQRITNILNLNANVGGDRLEGVDISATYDVGTPIGRFGFLANATYLGRYDRTLADGTILNGAGTFDLNVGGNAGAYPRWRGVGGINWRYQGFTIGLRTSLIGSFIECSDGDGLFTAGLCSLTDQTGIQKRRVDAWNNWDANVGYMFTSPVGRTSLTVGMTNIFNQTPPRIYNGFAHTTDTFNYDLVLRQVFFRLAQNF